MQPYPVRPRARSYAAHIGNQTTLPGIASLWNQSPPPRRGQLSSAQAITHRENQKKDRSVECALMVLAQEMLRDGENQSSGWDGRHSRMNNVPNLPRTRTYQKNDISWAMVFFARCFVHFLGRMPLSQILDLLRSVPEDDGFSVPERVRDLPQEVKDALWSTKQELPWMRRNVDERAWATRFFSPTMVGQIRY